MYSNEHTLQDLLKRAYHRLDMDDRARELEVVRVYRSVVGDLISRLTVRARFANGVLTVELASAALRQELTYRRSALMDRINESLGSTTVRRIDFMNV